MLEVRNLKTHFFTRHGVVKATDGVSFSVNSGETLGLVGESGSGKSVTILSILGLIPRPGRIVEGEIIFKGDDLTHKSEAEMRTIRGSQISIILQDPLTSLNPVYTIGNQVSEAVKTHQNLRGKSLQERVVKALKLVKIPAAKYRVKDYPHQMSGGMRQRVTGAIALSCHPSLLLADEPTTSLDVTIQAQYLELLQKIQSKSGISIIFVTHDFGIVARMCDKVAVMYAGKIVEVGDVREIFNNPLHPYTAALLQCLPKIDTTTKLISIEGDVPDLSNLSSGCAFAPRCTNKMAICEEKYPDVFSTNENHNVNCWKVGIEK
jgi:oligopeptide/dipeptide ABC transporter ATP-binding protein